MRLLIAELRKLRRPLLWGVAGVTVLFCVLLAVGGSSNAVANVAGSVGPLPTCAQLGAPSGPVCARAQASEQTRINQIQAGPAVVAGLGVRAAADGGALLSPAVTMRLLREFTARRPAAARQPGELARLTPRERDVLDLVVRGRSNAEIARDLVVTQSTVKTHLAHILDKLGLRDRVQAVVYGYEHGLIAAGGHD